jgi:tetratricopeptide (TPR) repeat protein
MTSVKRFLAAALVIAAVVGVVLAYQALTRDREYRRLIAEGERGLAADETFVAIEKFSGAIALRRDAMLGYLRRGETYRRRGENEKALEDLRRATELDPTATRPVEALGDTCYQMGRYEQAARHYGAFVRLDNQSARVLYKLALARYLGGAPLDAVQVLRDALKLQPRFAEAHYLLGLVLTDTGRGADARAAFARAIDVQPAMVFAREELATLHRADGHHSAEIEQLEALAALDTRRPDRQISLALAHARAGRTDLAVLTLGRAAEHAPEQSPVYTALGRMWLAAAARGDRIALSKALEALEGAMTAPGATSETLTLLGRALVMKGDAQLAELVLSQAVTRYPLDTEAFAALADAAERAGHPAVARDALINDAKLSGANEATARRVARARRIGELSARLQDYKTAVEWLGRAAAAAPNDPVVAAQLGEAQWRAGDHEAARATIAAALEREPRHALLLSLQRRLR